MCKVVMMDSQDEEEYVPAKIPNASSGAEDPSSLRSRTANCRRQKRK
jgi:hypothetical protein